MYPFGYPAVMTSGDLLEQGAPRRACRRPPWPGVRGHAPHAPGVRTRPEAPTLETAAKIEGEAGFELAITPRIEFAR